MNILMVLTSQAHMGETEHSTGLWLEELAAPYYAFVNAGANVTLASPKGGEPPIDPRSLEAEAQTETSRQFRSDPTAQAKFSNTAICSQVEPESFDALFFPGGHGPMWDLATSEDIAKLVEKFYRQGKVIGAVCHGPAALLLARTKSGDSILKGKSVTGFTNQEEEAVELSQMVPFLLETRLQELSGRFSCESPFQPYVVTDGQLITGQNPASSEAAAKAVLNSLTQTTTAQ